LFILSFLFFSRVKKPGEDYRIRRVAFGERKNCLEIKRSDPSGPGFPFPEKNNFGCLRLKKQHCHDNDNEDNANKCIQEVFSQCWFSL
jgi:hypothetical protein